MTHTPHEGQHDGKGPPVPEKGEAVIARELTGELYCIGCGYNLRGLSIRASCPECGVPVRATILGIVDPSAGELAPLYFPRASAIGLLMWSFGAAAAVLCVWLLRAAEVLRYAAQSAWHPAVAPWVGIACLFLSMLGAATLIRPHREVSRRDALRAAFGVSMYGPLIVLYWGIYLGHDAGAPSPVLEADAHSPERTALRLMVFLVVALIVWGLRSPALGLATRSVVVRTGRVDRQSLVAVLAALGVATLGDLLSLAGVWLPAGMGDFVSIFAIVVIALGSMLFTLGLINICIDAVRLYPVLVRPGVGLSDIFETNREKSRGNG